jgi:hypothetical protein
VCFGAAEGGALEVSLQGTNTHLPTFINTSLFARILSCVVSCNYSLSYALNLV